MSELRSLCESLVSRWKEQFTKEEMKRIFEELVVYEFYHVDGHIIHMLNRAYDFGPGSTNKSNSLLAFALGITKVKPERNFDIVISKTQPDFDIDFEKYGRDQLKAITIKKYGKDKVANIGTFAEYKPKSAFRDMVKCICGTDEEARIKIMSKAYLPANNVDLETGEWIDFSTLLVNEEFANYVQYIVDKSAEVLGDDKIADIEEFTKIIELLRKSYRQTGKHAAGMVISDVPLRTIVPVQLSEDGQGRSTQIDMKSAEIAGLCKIDFLGLGTLSVVQNTLNKAFEMGYIPERMTIDDIPLDDPEVFDFLDRGLYAGIFQLKSQGIRTTMRKSLVRSIEDISDVISIHRPGPMSAGFEEKYIAIKNGRMEPQYLHPDLEPILGKTGGLIIYQESLIRIAQDIAGFTANEGDNLRRIVGKKLPAELQEIKTKFINGCIKHSKWESSVAEELWGQIVGFGNYGFNKCLSKDTLVATPTGKKKIKDIHDGDEVYSLAGDNYVVTNVVRAVIIHNGLPVNEYNICGVNVSCTNGHMFLTKDGYKVVKDIKDGLIIFDHVGMPSLKIT